MADTMLEQRDDAGKPVYPIGGTRVLAYPAAHYAVADGKGDYAFVYLNVRMAAGRTEAVKKRIGDALLAQGRSALRAAASPSGTSASRCRSTRAPGQVYDGKHGNLHPLFNK